MKSFLIFLILSTNIAQAETLYKCEFTAVNKTGIASAWTKGVYLSNDRSVDISFSSDYKTVINARVDEKGIVNGWVNGQYNFVLKGNVKSGGFFESASSKGTFTCSEEKNYPVGFVFGPWNVIFVLENTHTIISMFIESVGKNECYFGRPNDAVQEIRAKFALSKEQISSDAQENVLVTLMERTCLERAYPPYYDDPPCTKWDIYRPVVHVLRNCDDHTSYP